jgi:mannan endo-1,4-beta-mannosidase
VHFRGTFATTRRLQVGLAALIAVVVGCAQAPGLVKDAFAPPSIRAGAFVAAEDGAFVLGGHPVRFVGANAALVHGQATRDATAETLAAMNAGDLRVARFWALGETDRQEDWARTSAFRTGPDAWVEESFEHLDHVLARAREENVRLIVVLGNRWRDHGGLPQYARWAGIPGRYDNLMSSELAATLANPRVRELYFEHIERVVSRVNGETGVAYADDPTIFAWEIFNEASASTCAAQRELVRFLSDAAQKIRDHDESHLIAAGHIGYNSPQSRRFWREIHDLEWVGYADTHGYPQNLLAAESPERFGDWLSDRATLAREIGKPLVVGEVGIPREWSDRERWFRVFFERADEEGVGALMPWIYRPHEEDRDDAHGIWTTGPRAAESEGLRALLTQTSRDFAMPAKAPVEHTRFPLGIETIRPFVHGEWEDGRFRTDPWAHSEGCSEEGEAFALYGLNWNAPDGSLQTMSLPGLQGTVDAHIDGNLVGRFVNGQFEAELTASLPARDAGVAWLRLDALDEEGVASLRRFTAEPPGEGALELIVR